MTTAAAAVPTVEVSNDRDRGVLREMRKDAGEERIGDELWIKKREKSLPVLMKNNSFHKFFLGLRRTTFNELF